jgi:hypothetical protein
MTYSCGTVTGFKADRTPSRKKEGRERCGKTRSWRRATPLLHLNVDAVAILEAVRQRDPSDPRHTYANIIYPGYLIYDIGFSLRDKMRGAGEEEAWVRSVRCTVRYNALAEPTR